MLNEDIGNGVRGAGRTAGNGLKGFIRGAVMFGAIAALVVAGAAAWPALSFAYGAGTLLSLGTLEAVGAAITAKAVVTSILSWGSMAALAGGAANAVASMLPGKREGHDWGDKLAPSNLYGKGRDALQHTPTPVQNLPTPDYAQMAANSGINYDRSQVAALQQQGAGMGQGRA